MNWILIAADVVLISILVLGFYRARHGRKDLVISFIGANIGVLIVAGALSSASTSSSLGVGLGLFGVLSIIRLRSTELEQYDVAYFFSSLAMGLLTGLGVGEPVLTVALMSLPVVALAIIDHPRFLGASRHQRMILDHAYPLESELKLQLERSLMAEVVDVSIVMTDMVQDKTIVDVTYKVDGRQKNSGLGKTRQAARVNPSEERPGIEDPASPWAFQPEASSIMVDER